MVQKSRARSAAKKQSKVKEKEIVRRQKINETQENEIDLLTNMYLEDFTVLDDDIDYEFPRVFSVTVRGRNESNLQLTLRVRVPREYPDDALNLSLVNVKGLLPQDQRELLVNVSELSKSKIGEVCVYDCVTLCTDYLDDHGFIMPESFHAEMTNRLALKNELQTQTEQERRRQQENIENSIFQQRVEEEIYKKTARIERHKTSSSPGTVTVASSPKPNGGMGIFAMEDLDFDSFSDAKDDEMGYSTNGSSGSATDDNNSTEETEDQTDDEMIAMSFNEQVGTPLQLFLTKRNNQQVGRIMPSVQPISVSIPNAPKMPSLYDVSIQLRKSSRYLENFAELGVLGRGGFGSVVKARNVLDGIVFGVKKVPLPLRNHKARARILREVTTIARLHHRYIVRYYQSWIERCSSAPSPKTPVSGAFTVTSTPHATHDSVHDWMSGAINSAGSDGIDDDSLPAERETLFIQFEYCPNKTLRDVIDEGGLAEHTAWRIMRQLCEALHYIHQQGVVHRDIKPPNVFFDESGDIKIGDFGLAVSRNADDPIEMPSDDHKQAVGQSVSEVAGTPYYRSPELEAGGIVSEKTDMYALGITLFEMFTSFSTLMERHVALTALRKTGRCNLEMEFSCKRFGKEFRAITCMLLAPNPKDRPSADALLRQGLIPLAEDEAQIQSSLDALSIPTSTFRSRVVEALFRLTPDRAVDVTYDMDPLSLTNLTQTPASVLTSFAIKTVNRIEDIFRRHGAVKYSTPILTPKLTVIKESSPIVMLDAYGVLVQLPHSLTVPFARTVALRSITSMRRYDISRVYRQPAGGGQPIQILVAAFDMVYLSSTPRRLNLLYTCELLRVLDDTLSVLIGANNRAVIYVNDLIILEAILEQVVPLDKFPQARPAIESQFGRVCYSSWSQIRRSLIQDYGLTEESALVLDCYAAMRGDPAAILPKFEAALNGHGLGALPFIRAALESLKSLFRLIDETRLTHKIRFHACIVADWHVYRRGLVFQVVHDASGVHKSIAIGGRYDDLISRFQSPASKSTPQCALGMSIALESLLPNGSQDQGVSSSVLLFCNANKLLEERFRLAVNLWSNGFQAEYDVDPSVTLAALPRYCRLRNIRFLVVFRAAQYSSGTVKVFDITKHHQHGDRHAQGHPVELNNLISHLQAVSGRKGGTVVHEKDIHAAGADANTTMAQGAAAASSSTAAPIGSRNVVEIIEDSESGTSIRGHVRNQHIRTATTLSTPLTAGCEASQYRIVAIPLPISAIRLCLSAFYTGHVEGMRLHCGSARHAWRSLLLLFVDWLQQQLERNRITLRYIFIYSTEDRKLDLLQL